MAAQRILLADDETYVTATLAAKLRKAGFEVAVACNGQEGFELATQNPPDLIITDYQMPILSGFDMATKLKEQPSTSAIPLIMITARGHHLSAEQLARTNIRALLAKPFSAMEVVEKAKEIFNSARPSQAA